MDLPSGYSRDETVPLRRRPGPPPDRRRVVAFPVAAGALLVLFVGVHGALNTAAVTRSVRLKVLAKLEERLGPIALGPDVSIGWLGAVHLGPMQILVPEQRLPLVQVDTITARPSLWGLLQLRAEPGAVHLSEVTIRTDRHGQRLIDFIRSCQREPSQPVGPAKRARDRDLTLDVEHAHLVLDAEAPASNALALGPFDGSASLVSKAGATEVEAELKTPGRGRVRLHASADEAKVEVDRFPLAAFAELVSGHGVQLSEGRVDGKVSLQRDERTHAATAMVDLTVSKLTVESARLASAPVGPAEGELVGTFRADLHSRKAASDGVKLVLGPTHVEVPLEVAIDLGDNPSFSIDARLGPVGLQQLIGSAPPQLQPGASLPKLDGPVRAEVRLGGPPQRPEQWSLDVRLDTAALKTACREAPFPLRDDFSYTPKDQVGQTRTLLVGPRNPAFVPYEQMPAVIPGAVLSSEDGSFMVHNGFDFAEIQDAFASGEEGARMRGGSTLTQQLVKNLYLTRERTLARKIREAFITLEVEAALPKTRILELYLNIIEWGPGIYGIGEASRYYFGIDARYLDAKQAAFLATIIPNPKKFGPYFKRHPLTDVWLQRMAKVLGVMRERGILDASSLEQAQTEPLQFRGG